MICKHFCWRGYLQLCNGCRQPVTSIYYFKRRKFKWPGDLWEMILLIIQLFFPNTLLRRNLKIELKEGLALIILFFSIFQNNFNTKFHEESIFVVFVGVSMKCMLCMSKSSITKIDFNYFAYPLYSQQSKYKRQIQIQLNLEVRQIRLRSSILS